jgi:hypothetical protein
MHPHHRLHLPAVIGDARGDIAELLRRDADIRRQTIIIRPRQRGQLLVPGETGIQPHEAAREGGRLVWVGHLAFPFTFPGPGRPGSGRSLGLGALGLDVLRAPGLDVPRSGRSLGQDAPPSRAQRH